jgi:HD-GYP domain-containing protein (c-di-GMP phosphodiesterase class II)
LNAQWLEVDIRSFRYATRDISFDVYLKLSETNYAHVFSRATGLDYRRLSNYMRKGVEKLYVRLEDEPAYATFVSRTADQVFNDPTTPTERKVAILLNMTEQAMTELFTHVQARDEQVEGARQVVSNHTALLSRDPQSLALLLKLASHGDYLYYHSIATSVFSVIIARASGVFDRQAIEWIGLGGLLHDIGCARLPKSLLSSPDALTEAEWEQMRDHPRMGLSMLEGCRSIADEVRYIVYQHHERPEGGGYPNSLQSPAIYPPAMVVALADAFGALISKRPFRQAYSPKGAIEVMRGEKGKFDPLYLDLLASVFGRSGSSAPRP